MITQRFTGTVALLCDIDVSAIIEWLHKTPQTQWYKFHDAMTDESRAIIAPAVSMLCGHFPPDSWHIDGLWHLAPGGGNQPTHIDEQPASWLARVHAPIVTNDQVQFLVGGERHKMEVGKAYLLNTLRPHSVVNRGNEHRVHLAVDFGKSCAFTEALKPGDKQWETQTQAK